MEINGVRFIAGFDREGLFKGHSASIVLDWLNETQNLQDGVLVRK